MTSGGSAAPAPGRPADTLAHPSLGRRIREARRQRGLTLVQLAGNDFTHGFLSQVERDKRRPSLGSLALIARRLDLPLAYFLDEAPVAARDLEPRLDEAKALLDRRDAEGCLRLLDTLPPLPEEVRPRALLLRTLALAALRRGHEALVPVQEALSLAERQSNAPIMPALLYAACAVMYILHAYEESLRYGYRALAAVTASPGDATLHGKILILLGHSELMLGHREAALAQYQAAVQVVENLRDLNSLGGLYAGLSKLYQEQGDVEQAVRYARLSVGVYDANQDRRSAAYELVNLAWRYHLAGLVEEAMETAREALARVESMDAPHVEANVRATLATIAVSAGDLDLAEAEATRALALEADESEHAHTDALRELAEVAERRGQTDRADALYTRAIDICRRSQEPARYVRACLAYSALLEDRDDLRGALRFSRLAAEAR